MTHRFSVTTPAKVVLAFLAILPASLQSQTIRNGSLTDLAPGLLPDPPIASTTPADWTDLWDTPDWVLPGNPKMLIPGLQSPIPASADGGAFVGMQGFDAAVSRGDLLFFGEAMGQNISGFDLGREYEISFEQINIDDSDFGDDGFFEVSMFGVSRNASTLTGGSNTWTSESLRFTATGPADTLGFTARDARLGNANPQFKGNAYLGIDGIEISKLPLLGPLRNFDVFNKTGQFANDFHLTLKGISPDQIGTTLWLESYPDAEVTSVPGGTRISWSSPNAGTPANFGSHFGYRMLGRQTNPSGVEMEWTHDGTSIGQVSATSFRWTELGDGQLLGEVQLDESFVDGEVYLSRRVAKLPGFATLDDLVIGGPAWESAELVDDFPVLIAPGETHALEVQAGLEMVESAVVIYDLLSGDIDVTLPREEIEPFLLATYFEAFATAPIEDVADGVMGRVNADDFIVVSGNGIDLLGLDFTSDAELLVPIAGGDGADPAPFGFLLANTSRQVTFGSLGNVVKLDGEIVTTVRYTGANPENDLHAFYGGPAGVPVRFDVLPRSRSQLAGDIDSDGAVGFSDFLILSANFAMPGSLADGDLDGNGQVDFPDFLILSNNFGRAVVAVPEPLGFLSLLIGILFCSRVDHARRQQRSPPSLLAIRHSR